MTVKFVSSTCKRQKKPALLIYIPHTEKKRAAETIESLATAGVLTVGESEEFSRAGGMITFVIENDKVRFEIDMDSVDRSGIKVSAQLQKLAIAVRRKS